MRLTLSPDLRAVRFHGLWAWLSPTWQHIDRGPAAIWMRRVGRYVQTAALVVLVTFLAAKLHAIGWSELWHALPRHAAFYMVLLMAYAVLPLSDALIYRNVWSLPLQALPLFFRKRVYNEALFDYSGEALFWAWVRRKFSESRRRRALFSVVRDVNLLSGLVSNTATLVLVMALFRAGVGDFPEIPLWAVAAGALLPTGVMLAILFARFFCLAGREALQVGALQSARLVTTLTLQATLWAIALPDVPFERWLIVLAAQMVVTRLPFLPNRELLMSGVVIALAPVIGATEVQIASTAIAIAALNLILHGLVLAVTGWRPVPAEPVPVTTKGLQ